MGGEERRGEERRGEALEEEHAEERREGMRNMQSSDEKLSYHCQCFGSL